MKKILFFADGTTIHTKKWIDMFRNQFELYLISFSKVHIKNVTCYCIDVGKISTSGGNFKYLFHILKVYKLINYIKPDIINAHFLTSYGFIASLLRYKIPVLLTIHGSDILIAPQKHFLYNLSAKFALSRLDYFFSAAKHITTILEKKYKVPSSKISTIQYGVDVKKIIRLMGKIKDIDFVSTRNLIKNSNVDIIIKAFKGYIENNRDKKIYIIGDGEEENTLFELANSLNLKKNVIFLGRLDHDDLLKILVRAKFYVSMTSSDGTSLSLLEAMASGAIPIVSDIPANRAVLSNYSFYSPIDVKQLTDTIENCYYDNSIIERNLKYIIKNANLNKNQKKIKRIFLRFIR